MKNYYVLLLCLCSLAHAMVQECGTNAECELAQGPGACCLFYQTSSISSFKCRPSAFVLYYTTGPNYNALDKIWTDPDKKTSKIRVNCKVDKKDAVSKFTYPYLQPWLNGTLIENVFDPVNPNVRSDQFYYPKQVTDWTSQFDKWFNTWFWQFTPIPLLIFTVDFWNYLIDSSAATQDEMPEDEKGILPLMYNTSLAIDIMNVTDASQIWGPFIYYDMFSLAGFGNWFWNTVILDFFFFIYEFWAAVDRSEYNDWTRGTVELMNYVDMNRLSGKSGEDPYDFEWHTQNPNGIDCNGNTGKGYYCYCPHQGYVCKCQKDHWQPQGKKTLECFDHYGYNCAGGWVDGQDNWCKDTKSIYWHMNQTL